jgi:hypothetical protein|tara:strand:- start:365 stop:511 length:147 start_codon:yes stop_codon:yes gene_type:complete
MKYILKNIGFFLVALGVVLTLFDFLIENKELIFIAGIAAVISSYFMSK